MQALGVIIIVKNSANKVLLGKRKNSYKPGFYGLPGGRVENKEQLLAAAQRELTEETSVVARDLTYVGFVKEWQEDHFFIHFVFKCEEWTGTIACVEPEKCEAWEWFPIDKLPSPLVPGHLGITLLQSDIPFIEL